jgi:PAS domain S-box-containing protein
MQGEAPGKGRTEFGTPGSRPPRRDRGRRPAEDYGLDILQILDALPFYVLLVDDRHRIVQANRAVVRHLGRKPEDIIGQHCPTIVHGLQEPWHACPLEEAVKEGRGVEREARDEHSGRWIKSGIYPTGSLTPDGRPIYFHMVSDITERREAEEELKASREQLRELSRHLVSLREEERTKMAREIHDELGQALTALKIDLSWLNGRLDAEQRALLEKVGSMYELIDEAIQTVKRISSELRPGALDHLGLGDAIEWQTQEFARRTGIKSRFTSDIDGIALERDCSTDLFRICQEALTNVARHAGATRVGVSLRERDGRLSLRIRDNGRGIGASEIDDRRAFGLIGMRERARFWGGDLTISGEPGRGTVVGVVVPFQKGTPRC